MEHGDSCAVCGRTILAGERTRTYVNPKSGPASVCELCRDRVEVMGWADPAAAGANLGRREDPPRPSESPAERLQRAVESFNAAEAARTVAGLTRTLGEPWVSVGASAGSPSEVRITVAWELSWYQWGVDTGDRARTVFALDKGNEIGQLDGSARQWNATAADGQIFLGAPTGERAPVG
jgi:hypothetical protein